jgi:regulator of sirC expression with transglutaminase-like and TPR domain
MGQEVIPKLERAWEEATSPQTQENILFALQFLQSNDTLMSLKKWRLAGAKDLLEGWFILSRFRYPNLDFQVFYNRLSRLAHIAWLDLTHKNKMQERVLAINTILYRKEFFQPADSDDGYAPDTFFLPSFWQQKTGNPFSLGMLYLLVSRKLDMPTDGIVLPNYLAIHYSDHKSDFYIDAFNEGDVWHKKHLTQFILESGHTTNPDYFLPASNRMILSGWLRLLIESYQKISYSQENLATWQSFLKMLA